MDTPASRHWSRRFIAAVLGSTLFFHGPCFVLAQGLAAHTSIALPGVQGRIDHLALDPKENLLYVAALGFGSVEVVDLAVSARTGSMGPFREPQGLAFAGNRLYVASGDGGRLQAFDRPASTVVASAALEDADNVRLDAAAGRLYVGYGHGLAVLDSRTLQVVKRFALAGHPEAFALEAQGSRIFVNVPGAGHVAVIDRKSESVVATWPLAGVAGNFPIALDEPNRRLFVATRSPSLLLVLDTTSGGPVARIPICSDADDLFFDESRRQLYAVCGEGFVDVVRQVDRDHYERTQRIATAAGARTGLFVPERSTLFVAVPARAGTAAEIRAYRIP